jgi:hypothetical protein
MPGRMVNFFLLEGEENTLISQGHTGIRGDFPSSGFGRGDGGDADMGSREPRVGHPWFLTRPCRPLGSSEIRQKHQHPDTAYREVVVREKLLPRMPEEIMSGEEFECHGQGHPAQADKEGITGDAGMDPSDENPGDGEDDQAEDQGAEDMPRRFPPMRSEECVSCLPRSEPRGQRATSRLRMPL